MSSLLLDRRSLVLVLSAFILPQTSLAVETYSQAYVRDDNAAPTVDSVRSPSSGYLVHPTLSQTAAFAEHVNSVWAVAGARAEVSGGTVIKSVSMDKGYINGDANKRAYARGSARGTLLRLVGPDGPVPLEIVVPDIGLGRTSFPGLPPGVPDEMTPDPQSLFSDAVPPGAPFTELNVFLQMDASITQGPNVLAQTAGTAELSHEEGFTATGDLDAVFDVVAGPNRTVANVTSNGRVLAMATIDVTGGSSLPFEYHNEVYMTGRDDFGTGGGILGADETLPQPVPGIALGPFADPRGAGGEFAVLLRAPAGYTFEVVPEPGGLLIALCGLGLCALQRRKKSRSLSP